MTAREAGKAKLKLASVPKSKDAIGFHVMEPVGNIKLEYWMDEATFNNAHIRTDKYTVGELLLLLKGGAVARRMFWPPNVLIRFDDEASVGKAGKNKIIRSAGITKLTLYEDDMNEGQYDIIEERWTPTQDDLWAKDYQTVAINFEDIPHKKGS